MRAGNLRKVVAIQQPTTVQGATGASRVTGWSAIADGAGVYADIDEAVGKELIQAGQVNPQRPVRVRIRYLAGVTAECRVVFGARVFLIINVQNVNQLNRELILTCVEKAP